MITRIRVVRALLTALVIGAIALGGVGAAYAAPSAPSTPSASPSDPWSQGLGKASADPCSGTMGLGKSLCHLSKDYKNYKAHLCTGNASSQDQNCASKSNGLSGAATSASSSALNATVVKPMADGVAEFNMSVIKAGLSSWLTAKSVSVEDSGVLASSTGTVGGQTVTYSLQAICAGVGMMIAVLLVIVQGMRMMVQRRARPLVDLIQGVFVNMLITAVGVAVIDALLALSDVITRDIIAVPFHGDDQLAQRMSDTLVTSTQGFNPIAELLMGLVVCITAIAGAVMMFLRQASVPVQALLLPIAGSGQLGGQSSRAWLPRLFSSIITVVAYKPMAAFLISIGFIEIGHGVGLADWIRGVTTLALTIVALPVMMRLFAPLGIATASAVGGSGFSGALAGMALLAGRGSEGGGSGGGPVSAVEHAQQMERSSGTPAGGPGEEGQAVRQANRPAASGPVAGAEGGPVPQQSAPENAEPARLAAADGGSGVQPHRNVSVVMRTGHDARALGESAGNTVAGHNGSEEQQR